MSYKLNDFHCEACDHIFEELVSRNPSPDEEPVKCPLCGNTELKTLLPDVRVNTMNLLSKQDYKAKMLKRSMEHTAKDLKQNGIPSVNNNNLNSLKVDKS